MYLCACKPCEGEKKSSLQGWTEWVQIAIWTQSKFWTVEIMILIKLCSCWVNQQDNSQSYMPAWVGSSSITGKLTSGWVHGRQRFKLAAMNWAATVMVFELQEGKLFKTVHRCVCCSLSIDFFLSFFPSSLNPTFLVTLANFWQVNT